MCCVCSVSIGGGDAGVGFVVDFGGDWWCVVNGGCPVICWC